MMQTDLSHTEPNYKPLAKFHIANKINLSILKFATLLCAFSLLYLIFFCPAAMKNHGVSIIIFNITLFTTYLVAWLHHFHHCQHEFYKALTSASKYLLVAGTYTPLIFIPGNPFSPALLCSVTWALACLGLIYRFFFYHDNIECEGFATLIVGSMGWVGLMTLGPIIGMLPMTFIFVFLGTSLAYCFGAIFFLWQDNLLNYALWHSLMLCASIVHFLLIYHYVLPLL